MKVRIKKLHPDAVIPSYAKHGDAGMDLHAVSCHGSNNYIEYKTGLSIEIPEGYVGLVFPRSSNSNKDLLQCNSVGVIDSGYRGEVTVRFKTVLSSNPEYARIFKIYDPGDRIAQLIIMPYPTIEFEEVEELSSTDRGSGGYGHTGN